MRRARWLAPWKDSTERPVIYHCVTRVVERRLAFGPEDHEKVTENLSPISLDCVSIRGRIAAVTPELPRHINEKSIDHPVIIYQFLKP